MDVFKLTKDSRVKQSFHFLILDNFHGISQHIQQHFTNLQMNIKYHYTAPSFSASSTNWPIYVRQRSYVWDILPTYGGGKLNKLCVSKKWAKPGLFCLFSFFSREKYSTNLTINYKSIHGVLGTRTRVSRMVGADKSTELWRRPHKLHSKYISYFYIMPTRLDTFLTAK